MSSTVISPMQTPNPMKKKVLAALIAVVVGHMGVLWAVNHMKAPELKPIEKEPLKVRFVKIQEPPKPLPPKPKEEPKKEPTKPKEVKIVEKPQPTPPKKVEKVQQVKKAEVVKPVVKPTETPVKPTVTTTITEKKSKNLSCNQSKLNLLLKLSLPILHRGRCRLVVQVCNGAALQNQFIVIKIYKVKTVESWC
jgi:cytoskeletal protein RodZ